MTVQKIEYHLSDFKYIAMSKIRKKLRFTLTQILTMTEGEPLGWSIKGCLAHITEDERLTWSPPAQKYGNGFLQFCLPFRRTHNLIVTALAKTKYVKQLTSGLSSYYDEEIRQLNSEMLNSKDEVIVTE